MRIVIAVVIVGMVCTLLGGCVMRAPVVPPAGFLFTAYQVPLTTDYDKTAATGRKGRADAYSVLGLVAFGDASAHAAAEDGGITTIDHADYSFTSILSMFTIYTTIVYGQ